MKESFVVWLGAKANIPETRAKKLLEVHTELEELARTGELSPRGLEIADELLRAITEVFNANSPADIGIVQSELDRHLDAIKMAKFARQIESEETHP